LLEHGGHLINAANQYNIPLGQWVDLSTGINPNGWQPPPIPAECWQRLPESNDRLVPVLNSITNVNPFFLLQGLKQRYKLYHYCDHFLRSVF
jgi:hypothetical protein